MENATTAGSSQCNISRIYIWKDKIKIENDEETLTQNRAAWNKSETHNRKYNRIVKQFQ